MNNEIVAGKYKCDSCGEILESGIVNMATHQFECKVVVTEKMSDKITAVYHPILSVTKLPEPPISPSWDNSIDRQ